jgi:MORN repeat
LNKLLNKFLGEWKNNQAHGKGKFYHADGDIFDGEWKNDKANGHGVYTHVNGAKYEGNWKDDLQHGHGKEAWADGSTYEGEYKLGKKHGKGRLKKLFYFFLSRKINDRINIFLLFYCIFYYSFMTIFIQFLKAIMSGMMARDITVIGRIIKLAEKGFIIGQMVGHMMAIG